MCSHKGDIQGLNLWLLRYWLWYFPASHRAYGWGWHKWHRNHKVGNQNAQIWSCLQYVFNMSPFQFPVPWPHGFHRSRLRWLALELKDARLEERIDRGRIGFSRSMWQRPPVASPKATKVMWKSSQIFGLPSSKGGKGDTSPAPRGRYLRRGNAGKHLWNFTEDSSHLLPVAWFKMTDWIWCGLSVPIQNKDHRPVNPMPPETSAHPKIHSEPLR